MNFGIFNIKLPYKAELYSTFCSHFNFDMVYISGKGKTYFVKMAQTFPGHKIGAVCDVELKFKV